MKEATTRGFKDGRAFYSLFYPTAKCLQIGNEIFVKDGFANLLWVKARTAFGEVMDVPIADTAQNKWATFEAPVTVAPKVSEWNTEVKIKKGDFVRFTHEGTEARGRIVSYGSNKAIGIEGDEGVVIVDKNAIQSVISHG